MRGQRPLLHLTPEEVAFLRQCMHDEVHFQEGRGPAKQLQLDHRVLPGELAEIIVAAIPRPADQLAASGAPPAEPPVWTWSEEGFRARLAEARAVLSVSAVLPRRPKHCRRKALDRTPGR